jgi:hypothetical protein
MNTKAKGTRNEHRSMTLLEATGYRCTRAAASLGAWDIIGIDVNDVILLQVKTRDWPGVAEMETLRDFPTSANCRKLVHRWRDRQRGPDVKEVVCPTGASLSFVLTAGGRKCLPRRESE